jgi:hypothetical protein
MALDPAFGEPLDERGIGSTAVVGPDRGIDQNHRPGARGRRRRIGVFIGNRPPRSASRIEARMDQRGLFRQPGEISGPGDLLIVEIQGGAHLHQL